MPSPTRLAVLCCLSALVPAQTKPTAPTAFQTKLVATLKNHAFFRDVTMDIEAGKPPFLFLVQAPLRRDEDKYLQLVISPVQAHLAKLLAVFDATYCKPNGLAMRPDAAQIAIAILGSRGLYDDYARATNDPFLHESLAHYNHDLRLAVTYRAGLGSSDASEARHSLLHEVVHALQHAYAANGAMPKPTWFDEGLAEYRAASTHVASSLEDPPLIDDHVVTLLQAYAHPEGRKLLLPLPELVVPESYGQVIAAVEKHAGATVDPGIVLTVFYAQAEMVVRFLHEAEGGKYRAGFLRYFAAVESGAAGLQAFHDAFELKSAEAMAELGTAWQKWLATVFGKRLGLAVDLGSGKGLERHAMPPPSEFDFATLAWLDDELPLRLTGIQRVCADGDFERAAGMLPTRIGGGAANDARLRRERETVQALADLRERVAEDLPKRRPVELGGAKGKFVRRDGNEIVLDVKGAEVRVPLSPRALVEHGVRLKAFAYADAWKEAYLRWLAGEPRSALATLLAKEYSRIQDLRTDLTADLDATYGAEALALERFQQMTMPTDRAAARTALADLLAATRRGGPLFTRRKPQVELLARALAERAFDLDDAEALGVHGKVTSLGDGRVEIQYADPAAAPDLDFALWPDAPFEHAAQARLAYDGPTGVFANGETWSALGQGFLRWAMPIVGAQKLEFDYEINGQNSSVHLMLCVAPGRYLLVTASGALVISDDTTGIRDQAGQSTFTINEPHHMVIEHDGTKSVAVSIDGKRTALLPAVGNCLGGSLVLGVRSSTPVVLRRFAITGKLDPTDPPAIRTRYVEHLLAGLWPTAAAGKGEQRR